MKRDAFPMQARCVLLLLAASMSVGCSGSFFKTSAVPPTQYLLSAAPLGGSAVPDAPARATGASKFDVAVLKPHVRAGLDNDRIAALYPDRRLDYFADARWSASLDEAVEDLAVQLFHSQAALGNVSGDASAFASAYWLELEIADFQAEYSAGGGPPTVRVHLRSRLGSSGERRVIARVEAESRQPAAADRMSAIVDAYDRAANQALLQIAAGCASALASEPDRR